MRKLPRCTVVGTLLTKKCIHSRQKSAISPSRSLNSEDSFDQQNFRHPAIFCDLSCKCFKICPANIFVACTNILQDDPQKLQDAIEPFSLCNVMKLVNEKGISRHTHESTLTVILQKRW